MSRTIFDTAPPWWLRALFAAPRGLYQIGLGRLLGHRFLELEHRDHRTGRLRRTMVEVVAYDPWTRESVVVAAWGPRSDWYRNVLEGGAARVRTAGARYTPDHRVLAQAEARGLLAAYERRNAAAVKLFRRLLRLRPDEPFPDLASRMPLVAFRPRVPP